MSKLGFKIRASVKKAITLPTGLRRPLPLISLKKPRNFPRPLFPCVWRYYYRNKAAKYCDHKIYCTLHMLYRLSYNFLSKHIALTNIRRLLGVNNNNSLLSIRYAPKDFLLACINAPTGSKEIFRCFKSSRDSQTICCLSSISVLPLLYLLAIVEILPR